MPPREAARARDDDEPLLSEWAVTAAARRDASAWSAASRAASSRRLAESPSFLACSLSCSSHLRASDESSGPCVCANSASDWAKLDDLSAWRDAPAARPLEASLDVLASSCASVAASAAAASAVPAPARPSPAAEVERPERARRPPPEAYAAAPPSSSDESASAPLRRPVGDVRGQRPAEEGGEREVEHAPAMALRPPLRPYEREADGASRP